MKKSESILNELLKLGRKRIPGQLVIQMTDRCNATCPQCGMRKTEKFKRSTLDMDTIKKTLDAAATKGFVSVSFTGGEPLMLFDELIDLIKHAEGLGMSFIRTGTNGFPFAKSDQAGYEESIHKMAEALAGTSLRNFWISIDSAIPEIHEKARGFNRLVAGIEKALPIFHRYGVYPSANLGINRNIAGDFTYQLSRKGLNQGAYLDSFLRTYREAFRKFFRFVIDLGFTIVNTCYPMSVKPDETQSGLDAVYAATSQDRVINYEPDEKMVLYQALLEVIPEFRRDIRIFTPMSSLYSLINQHSGEQRAAYTCRGGIDFFLLMRLMAIHILVDIGEWIIWGNYGTLIWTR